MDIRHCYVPNLPGLHGEDLAQYEDATASQHAQAQAQDQAPPHAEAPQQPAQSGFESNRIKIEDKSNHSVSGKPKQVIVVAKHLCGAATDLAIRSLEAFWAEPENPHKFISSSGDASNTSSTVSPAATATDVNNPDPFAKGVTGRTTRASGSCYLTASTRRSSMC
jgi:Methyltransferase TRM13